MYKLASRLNLKVETSKGELSISQLWTLKQSTLAETLRSLASELKKNKSYDDLSFLDEITSEEDKILQLKFNIVKDIYITKKEEATASIEAQMKKEQLQKILAIRNKANEASLEERISNMNDDEFAEYVKSLK